MQTMSLSIANYLLYIGYMLASVAMAVLFSFTYLLTTPARELHLIKQGNVACALSFGGALVGFCLALASAMTHSLNILDFVLWGAGAALVFLGARAAAGVTIKAERVRMERIFLTMLCYSFDGV